jgi:hypothetical protein
VGDELEQLTMPAPQPGQIVNGYRYKGGNPNSQGSWEQVSGMTKVYQDTLDRARAKADEAKIQGAVDGVRASDDLLASAAEARQMLPQTPTGGFGDARKWAGQHLGFMAGVLGVPDRDETANLERFDQLSNASTLADVGKLKGPMSDKDVAFLKSQHMSINTSREGNDRAIAAQEWAAKRMKAYESALQAWTRVTGSPSATNPAGQSFDAWFSGWAAKNIPAPYLAHGQAAKATAAPPRKPATVSQGQGWKIVP